MQKPTNNKNYLNFDFSWFGSRRDNKKCPKLTDLDFVISRRQITDSRDIISDSGLLRCWVYQKEMGKTGGANDW